MKRRKKQKSGFKPNTLISGSTKAFGCSEYANSNFVWIDTETSYNFNDDKLLKIINK